MPRRQSPNPFLQIQHLDLAYAVERLVQLGTADVAQVQSLAAERMTAIELLEARIAALGSGVDLDAPTLAKRRYTRRAAKQGRAQKPAQMAKRPVGRPKGSKNKPKTLIAKAKKPAKRKVTLTPKMAAARKLQGRYLGLRRQLSPDLQAQATKIAHAEGVAAALKFLEANRVTKAA